MNEETERELMTFALGQAANAARLALVGTVIIGAVAAPGVGVMGACVWVLATLGVLLWRNWALARAGRRLLLAAGVQDARQVLGLTSGVLALVLAALPALAFPLIDAELRFVLTLFFCCWGAAGMASLGVIPVIFAIYLAVMLSGILTGWARSGDAHALAISAGLTLYWMVLQVFSRNFSRRISEGIAIRTQNAELVRQLSAANAAKSRFIMAASHDLRQPLHAIGLLGGLLARATNPGDLDHARAALVSALNGLNTLFSAIMDLTHLDSGTLRPKLQAVPVHQLVGRLDVEYRALCIEKGRRWECQSEQAHAWTDPVMLERILRNLLDNAIKYGGQGAVRLAVIVNGPETVTLTVADLGPGIPELEQEKVFDEFYRGAEATETGGMGLGLAIVKRFSQLLGGRLKVSFTDRDERMGACFSLALPTGGIHALQQDPRKTLDAKAPDVSGLSVLVLDDESAVLDATRVVLVQWGCDVRTCRTRKELASMSATPWRPDVALVDYRFEASTTGLEAVAPLCNTHPSMGVIVVTGESDSHVLAQLADSGLPVLAKPVDPDELRLTLSLFKSVT